tara:strand:- start:151 stop:1788 length:1638 start_codon:yes stop_codon:yes gene_type:complete
MLMGIILYVDRYAFSIAQPYIRQELGLTKSDFSYALSAFFWFYAIGQMPAGWLSDRFGPRLLLTSYIVVWSFFAATVGLAGSLLSLCLARAAFGLGQAGAFPTASAIVGRWMPQEQRGKASSFVALGGRIGGAIVPIISAMLLVAFLPPNQSYELEPQQLLNASEIVESLTISTDDKTATKAHFRRIQSYIPQETDIETNDNVDVLLTQIFNEIINDPEFFNEDAFNEIGSMDRFAQAQIDKLRNGEGLAVRDSQRMNRHLLESIYPVGIEGLYVASWRPVIFMLAALGIVAALLLWFVLRDYPHQHPRVNPKELEYIVGSDTKPPTVESLPVRQLLRCRSMWTSALSQFCVNIGWLFIVTWFVEFLMEEHHVAMAERSDMIAVPLMVGFIGMLFGGVATDRLSKLVGLRFGRALPWTFAMLIAAVCFFICPFLDNPWAITWAMALVALSVDFSVPSMWAFTQDVGGRYVGVVLGFGNMFGNIGAAVSPILLAYVQESYGWDTMFVLCGAAFIVAAVAAFFVDASKPITLPGSAELAEPNDAIST